MQTTQPLDDDRVMSLVELALSRPPREREAYLMSVCAGDAGLFAAVANYVRAEERMNGFLLDPFCPKPVIEHPFEPGELVDDRFRVVREVARGGMGVVYEVKDEKLDRRVAIKCAREGFNRRLPPEVRNAREISHSNVCRIFEMHTATTARGQIDFITMEFLDGETLLERLRAGPIGEPDARAIALQLCAGLAEAHRNHVIHGDLKSGNVILTTGADGATRAVITDFGLARGIGASGEVGGTPDYMAPELWKGAGASIASDIYALGVILFEMLAAGKPHPEGESWERRLTGKPPAVHPKWDRILARCLDPDPARRFHDAEEIARAFAPSRARRRFLAVAAVAILVVASGVAAYERASAPKESARLALMPFGSDRETAQLADGLFRDTAAQLSRLKGSARTGFTFVTGKNANDRATHVLHGTLGVAKDRIVLAAYLTDTRSGVNAKEWKAEYTPGEFRRYAPVALAGMVTGALRLPPASIATVSPAAAHDYWAGVWATRRNSTLDVALRSLSQAVAEDPDSPLTHAALAEAQWFEYPLTQDRTWLDRAGISLREAESRNPDVAAAHRVEGYLHYADDSYAQAVPEFERAIELQPGKAMAHIYLGKAYEDNDQLEAALAEFLKASEVEPEYFRTWQNLGAYYQNRSDFQQMARYHKKAVDLAPNEPNLHSNLGGAYMSLGQFALAERELRRSIGLLETPAAYSDLGQILMSEGRDQEAVHSFELALNLPSPPGATPKYLVLVYLGIAQRRLHRVAAARDANIEGLRMVEAENPRNVRDGDLKSFMGYFSAACGDRTHAVDYIETALRLFPDSVTARWYSVLTYEELYRASRDPGYRRRTLEILAHSTNDQLADVSRWPDLADLHEDLRFKDLVASHQTR